MLVLEEQVEAGLKEKQEVYGRAVPAGALINHGHCGVISILQQIVPPCHCLSQIAHPR